MNTWATIVFFSSDLRVKKFISAFPMALSHAVAIPNANAYPVTLASWVPIARPQAQTASVSLNPKPYGDGITSEDAASFSRGSIGDGDQNANNQKLEVSISFADPKPQTIYWEDQVCGRSSN